MNGPWLLQRSSFPSCAEAYGKALRPFRAAHGGQDDRVVRWADSVKNIKTYFTKQYELPLFPTSDADYFLSLTISIGVDKG